MKKILFLIFSAIMLPAMLSNAQETPVTEAKDATVQKEEAVQEIKAEDTAKEDAEEIAEEDSQENREMTVNADSAEVTLDAHNHPVAIELDGNVIIEDDSMRFTAKKMTVHLDNDNKPCNIVAVGGVTVRKLDGSGSANGDTGIYDAEEDKVTLKGNCVILQGKNTIKGEQVVFDRKTGSIRLKGASISLPIKKGSGSNAFGALINTDKKQEKTEADKKADKTEEVKEDQVTPEAAPKAADAEIDNK